MESARRKATSGFQFVNIEKNFTHLERYKTKITLTYQLNFNSFLQ